MCVSFVADLNTKLKSLSNYKKRYEKLREDIVDIFKDGVVLTGGKNLLMLVQSNGSILILISLL